MELDKNHQQENESASLNANSAYSGSGATQPGGGTGHPGKISDYPNGNLADAEMQADAIAGNKSDTTPVPRTIDEATDPTKLSDL